jgi:hypothetical protein
MSAGTRFLQEFISDGKIDSLYFQQPVLRLSRCANCDPGARRAVGEVREPQFDSAEGDLDAEMVAIAGAIIRERTGVFDPSTYRDCYQEALQQLIAVKMKALTIKPRGGRRHHRQ